MNKEIIIPTAIPDTILYRDGVYNILDLKDLKDKNIKVIFFFSKEIAEKIVLENSNDIDFRYTVSNEINLKTRKNNDIYGMEYTNCLRYIRIKEMLKDDNDLLVYVL